MGYAIHDKRGRYVEWMPAGNSSKGYEAFAIVGRELHDYEKDPMETANAVDEPAHGNVVDEMNRRMQGLFNEQSQQGVAIESTIGEDT